MKKVCVFSVIFPANLAYFDDYLVSLNNQDFKNFDIVLLNDGVKNLNSILDNYKKLEFKIYPVKGSPAEIRQKGIEILSDSDYEKIIFADTDDYFSVNRISMSLQLLESYDVAVNDVSLVTEDKVVFGENYISHSLKDNTTFDYNYLINKNILGLSNTAINRNILSKVKIDSEIVAVDWFLFTVWLVKRKTVCVFSNKAITFYRQHSANTAGMGAVTEAGILKAIKVKLVHFKNLSHLGSTFGQLYAKFEALNSGIKDTVFRRKYIAHIQSFNLKYPLWWEEAKEY